MEWGRGSQEGLEAASCPSFVSHTALGILRMTLIPSLCVWETTKELHWESLIPGSTGLALSLQSLVPALRVLIQLGFGTEGQKGPFCDARRHVFPIIHTLFLLLSTLHL